MTGTCTLRNSHQIKLLAFIIATKLDAMQPSIPLGQPGLPEGVPC
jgi:hypothetical protein